MQDEQTLITRIQKKDDLALGELYDNYAGALYGVIIRICKDEQHAQNILQDTFMAIWDKAYQYNPEKGKFYTWAYRIARNKSLNFLRKSNNLIQTDDLSVYSNKEDVINIDPEFYELNGCIKKLDQHHQKAIELVYFNGLTHREAHKEMDVPLGTFKSYVRQALKKLKQNYNKALGLFLILIEFIK